MRYIYSISHPITGIVYYIGITKNLDKRKSQHCGRGRGLVYKWICELKKHKLYPVFTIIDQTDSFSWRDLECVYIDSFVNIGHPLLNKRATGELVSKNKLNNSLILK